MSKSLGNLVFVDALRKEWDPMAIRLGIIEHHYRTEWEWDDELMPRSADRLDAWRGGRRRAARATCSTRCAPRSTTTSTRPRRVAAIDAAAAGATTCGAAAAPARRRSRRLSVATCSPSC